MADVHAKAKEDENSLLYGDEYVLASEFLIDVVIGEVRSLGSKVGSKVFASSSKGKDSRPLAEPVYKTTKEAKQAAELLGFKKSMNPSIMGRQFSKEGKILLQEALMGITGELGKWQTPLRVLVVEIHGLELMMLT